APISQSLSEHGQSSISSCFSSDSFTFCAPSSIEMKHSQSRECVSLPARSKAVRTTKDQVVQNERKLLPTEVQTDSMLLKAAEHKMVRIASDDGTSREVAAIPKASIQRPSKPKTFCPHCNDQPDGFHGDHELRRHIDRVHTTVRKVWVCV